MQEMMNQEQTVNPCWCSYLELETLMRSLQPQTCSWIWRLLNLAVFLYNLDPGEPVYVDLAQALDFRFWIITLNLGTRI